MVEEDINAERKIQTEMIKQFQLGKEGKGTINEIHQSKNDTEE